MDYPLPQDRDAGNDLEFSTRWAMRERCANSSSPRSVEISQAGRKPLRGRWRTRSLLVALVVVWMGLLLDPTVGRMFWDAALGFGITLAVLALAMGLGLIGFGLFAVGDRVLAWLKAGSRWPDDGF